MLFAKVPLPEEPEKENADVWKSWKRELRLARATNHERHSLRCDVNLKLSVSHLSSPFAHLALKKDPVVFIWKHDDLYEPPTSIEMIFYLVYGIESIFICTTYQNEEVNLKSCVTTVIRPTL